MVRVDCKAISASDQSKYSFRHRPQVSIVDTAIGAGNFTTLTAGIKAAGLTDTLTGKGPFTVFAPTDEAFKKLPAGAVDALLKDSAKLKAVLNYHVIAAIGHADSPTETRNASVSASGIASF